jgi:Cu(I)/Ag(I) efflux system membrane fusion protein
VKNQTVSLWTLILVLLIAAAVGSGVTFLYFNFSKRATHNDTNISHDSAEGSVENRKVLYWYDPMVPQHRFDKQGKSPFMDMDLVPKYADDNDTSTIRIDPTITHNLGVRTVRVRAVTPNRTLNAVGTLTFSTRDLAIVQTRSEGFVERAYPHAVGDVVKKGAPLIDLLIPAWVGAQQEFLALQTIRDEKLREAARQRLRLLGMPESAIDAVARIGTPQPITPITAPITGMIQSLDARTGMALSAGQTIAQIVALDPVWLDVAVPESSGSWIKHDDRAAIVFAAWPSEKFTGEVLDILPETQKDTRTLTVRLALPNPEQRLKPGMFAYVQLSPSSDVAAAAPQLVVPTEALIRTGQRTLVMLAEDGGRFRPAEVEIGEEIGDDTVIVRGVNDGEHVVTSGQFLIDSEASMKGVLARALDSAPSAQPAVPLHEADGEIIEIEDGQILLKHGDFPTLHMGGMTMLFPVARPELLEGFKAGDAVRVSVRADDQGLTIEHIRKIDQPTAGTQQ